MMTSYRELNCSNIIEYLYNWLQLDRATVCLTPQSDLVAELNLDSLSQAELFLEVARLFEVSDIPLEEISHIRTVQALCDRLNRFYQTSFPL